MDTEDAERRFRSFPFDEAFQLEQKEYCKAIQAKDRKLPYVAFFAKYFTPDNNWRKIDLDWLGAAADLALQLDNDTNNTSLALAIELIETGKVLLFPGDAQVGSWLSWRELSWSIKTGHNADEIVRTADLLRRTVFYKVGHHASYNATLKKYGLELMTSPDLVAAIPVDEIFARARKPKPWDMPASALYRRLLEKTKGRLLRSDRSWPSPNSKRPDTITSTAWSAFKESVNVSADELYIDYFIKKCSMSLGTGEK
jgi:hypothetical protein